MKNLLILLTILLFTSSIIAQAPACDPRDYSCQLKAATKALKADPRNPENYYNIAQIFQRSGNHKEAVESYSMYILIPGVKNEYLADGYNGRGISYRKLGQADLARADFGKAFELVPANPAFIANRGNANLDAERYDEALADYNRALVINPKFAAAYSGRAHLYMAMSKPDEAIRDFASALAVNPSDSESYYNRAVVYNSKREYAKAIADYDKYIPLMQGNPKYQADGYMNRGVAHATISNREQALSDFTKVIDLNPTRANAYRARSMILRELKRAALAAADEKKAADLEKEK